MKIVKGKKGRVGLGLFSFRVPRLVFMRTPCCAAPRTSARLVCASGRLDEASKRDQQAKAKIQQGGTSGPGGFSGGGSGGCWAEDCEEPESSWFASVLPVVGPEAFPKTRAHMKVGRRAF